jgi:hypothetical protein
MNYVCEICKYETTRLNNYTKHCETNKHKRNTIKQPITFSNYCELCNKSFQCSENYHKKFKCKNVVKPEIEPSEKKQELDIVNILCQFMQQHQNQMMEHHQKTIELLVNKPTVINNIDNSVDNSTKTIHNNVNIFLNEECKDAINWDDFIKNLQLPESVDAKITDIVRFSIHNQLKELGIYKRPIHCFKKKQLCIKNNDQWEENSSKNHKLFVNSLEQMKNQMIKNWEDKHPHWAIDEDESDIATNILAKINDNVDATKCIPHIMTQTTVDLE